MKLLPTLRPGGNNKKKSGCYFYVLRTMIWWGLFIAMSYFTAKLFPELNVNAPPLTGSRFAVACVELAIAYIAAHKLMSKIIPGDY